MKRACLATILHRKVGQSTILCHTFIVDLDTSVSIVLSTDQGMLSRWCHHMCTLDKVTMARLRWLEKCSIFHNNIKIVTSSFHLTRAGLADSHWCGSDPIILSIYLRKVSKHFPKAYPKSPSDIQKTYPKDCRKNFSFSDIKTCSDICLYVGNTKCVYIFAFWNYKMCLISQVYVSDITFQLVLFQISKKACYDTLP